MPPEPNDEAYADAAANEISAMPLRTACEFIALRPHLRHDLQMFLIETEYLCRRRGELSPTLEDFLARYPRFETELRRLFAASTLNHMSIEIEGFTIGEEIGRGGMGVVYRAHDLKFDREVAVKTIYQGLPDVAASRRFQAEAQITGQLQHPSIPAVHQTGVLADGRPYLVMKLIKKGRTLDSLKHEGTSIPRLIAAFEQVCQAVGYAHSRRVIHRDLKPQNVMIGTFGEVQVMDWGLAKVISDALASTVDEPISDKTEIRTDADRDSETHVGAAIGTRAWMPPEQAGGELGKIDERSDVFGLGAMLTFILTGQAPYVAKSAEQLRLMSIRGELSEAYTRLDSCDADPEWIALAKRCLSTDRDLRPKHAGVLAEEAAAIRAAAEERAAQAVIEQAKAGVASAARRIRHRNLAILTVVLTVLGLVAVRWNDKVEARQQQALAVAVAQKQTLTHEILVEAYQAVHDGQVANAKQRLVSVRKLLRTDSPENTSVLASPVVFGSLGIEKCVKDWLDELERECDFCCRLDAIREKHWTWLGLAKTFDYEAGRREYPLAFAEYGITLDEAGANHLSQSIIAKRLAAGLNDWLSVRPMNAANLTTFIAIVEKDPFRTTVVKDLSIAPRSRLVEHMMNRQALELPSSVAGRLVSHPDVTDEQARLYARQMALHRPKEFDLHYQLGQALSRREPGCHFDAASMFHAAITLDPSHTGALTNLGVILAKSDRNPEAYAYYERACAIDPHHLTAGANAVRLLLKMGRMADAERRAREMLAVAPLDSDCLNLLVESLIKLDKAKDAEALVATALTRNPLSFPDLALMGRLQFERQAFDDAVESFRRAGEVSPDNESVYYWHAQALGRANRNDQALIVARNGVKRFPKSGTMWNELRHYAFEERNHKEALDAAKTLVGLVPDSATFRVYLAGHYMHARRMPDAREAYRKGLAIEPTFYEAYIKLAETYEIEGKPACARRVLENSLKRFPGQLDIRQALDALNNRHPPK